jgi:hypothetical protein
MSSLDLSSEDSYDMNGPYFVPMTVFARPNGRLLMQRTPLSEGLNEVANGTSSCSRHGLGGYGYRGVR